MRGHAISISRPRRLVIDLLHFARDIPSVPVQKQMHLGALMAARASCRHRPRLAAIFAKAYAMVADEFPELRRAYVKLPYPHFFEYRSSVANIIVEREYRGEHCIFGVKIGNPAHHSLTQISVMIETAKAGPVEKNRDIRIALMLSALPRPLRHALWWLGLNWGRHRGRFFGTFGLSVYSALGAESLHPLMPITSLVNYGVIDERGNVTVRIIYDHRVLNGATVARALARLEDVLNREIVDELRSSAARPVEKLTRVVGEMAAAS